jgi:spermidine/putrescine transport system substrate-binding protein
MTDTILGGELTRRRFIAGTALTGAAAFLAACGTGGTGSAAPSAAASDAPSAEPGESAASSEPPAEQSPSPELNFANWPLYIDTDDDDPTKHKTLEDFTARYGTVVNYSEVINDNEEFFGTIRPPLQGGQDTGWDLIVVTDFMAARLIRLGWVETFDLARSVLDGRSALDRQGHVPVRDARHHRPGDAPSRA